MRISQAMLQLVLNKLPHPDLYEGEFFKIRVTEEASPHVGYGAQPFRQMERIFEFQKSEDGSEWLLASMPEY